jgi:ADP-ribosyl-[dinitrogen reductase] hydrolase
LLEGAEPYKAYQEGLKKVQTIYSTPEYSTEMQHFQRVINGAINELPLEQISSDGYVIDTLEASLWCLLNTNSYAQAVLKAVNLGFDTDTTAAVTGGLAGIYYGVENIPEDWINQIMRKNDIIDLANRFIKALNYK